MKNNRILRALVRLAPYMTGFALGVGYVSRPKAFLIVMALALLVAALLYVIFRLHDVLHLQRQARKSRPAVEAAMIAIHGILAAQPRDRMHEVLEYCTTESSKDGGTYRLQVKKDGCARDLVVSTRQGRMSVGVGLQEEGKPRVTSHWPALFASAHLEPWLDARLSGLQDLTEHAVDRYTLRKKTLEARLGPILDPFDTPTSADA